MPIDLPPVAPNRTSPSTFSSRMDDFLAWLVTAVPQFNTLALSTGSGSFTDGAAATPSLTFVADTNTGIFRPGNDIIAVTTAGSEAFRVNASNQIFMGSPNAITGIGATRISSQGATAAAATFAIGLFNNSAAGGALAFGKSRGTAVDTYAILNAGDSIGNVDFYGSDGVTLIRGAQFKGYVINTPAVGDVRAGFQFLTGNGAGTMATRLTIDDTALTATLPFNAANGAAANPSLSFANSPTTGIWRVGADIMGFGAAGVESFRINASAQAVFSKLFGYVAALGAGGAVTQATSRTTGVTLNTACGAITLFTAAGAATPTSFTVTNSQVSATDVVIVSVKSGTNTYRAWVSAVAAGSFQITFAADVGTASDAPVITFAILKASTT